LDVSEVLEKYRILLAEHKALQEENKILKARLKIYNGPRNLDSVLSYTWEQKRGGPSG